jgi:hypothetical protein
MTVTGNTSEARPLFDRSQPYGIVFYPFFRVPEASQILGWGPDKVRETFRNGVSGEVIQVPSQRIKPHKTRNYTTIFVPYKTLIRWLENNRVVA